MKARKTKPDHKETGLPAKLEWKKKKKIEDGIKDKDKIRVLKGEAQRGRLRKAFFKADAPASSKEVEE